MKRFIAFILCVLLIMPCAAFADDSGVTGSKETKEDGVYYTVKSTNPNKTLFEYEGLGGDGTFKNWPAKWGAGETEQTGSITFSFDGTTSATADGETYTLDGVPTKIKFLRVGSGYGGTSKEELNFLVSENKTEWYKLDTTYSYDGIEYTGRTENTDRGDKITEAYGDAANFQTWMSRVLYTLTVPSHFTEGEGEDKALKKTKYVRVAFTKKVSAICFALPIIEYEQPFSRMDVKNANSISPNSNNLSLVFSEPLEASTVTAASFSVSAEDGESISVSGASLGNDQKTVSLTLNGSVKPKTKYTVTVSEDVKTEGGSSIDIRTAEFTTLGQMEEVTFTDDMKGSGYLIANNAGEMQNSSDFIKTKMYMANNGTASWVWNFDGTKSKKQDDITYVFDGILKSVSINYYTHANYNVGKDAAMYASSDGESWTLLSVKVKDGASSDAEIPKQGWVGYGSISAEDIPFGTRYFKIGAKNVTANNFLFAAPTAKYVTGSGKTFIERAELDHYNEKTRLHLITFSNINTSELTADKFTVNGENPTDVEMNENGRLIILSFDGVMGFETEGRLEINGLRNVNGENVEGAEFKTEKEPYVITVSNRGDTLENDILTTSADITFNYKKDVKEMKIAYLTVVYNKDDKIVSRAVSTETVNVCDKKTFTNSVKIKSGERAETFILRDNNGYYPLDKAVVYPAQESENK